MALKYFDRIKEETATTGTGTITLAGAVAGFRSFADVGDGNTCKYTILDANGNWEVGEGTYTLSGTTLARTVVERTSAGNTSPITLSAGTHSVFLTHSATAIALNSGSNTGDNSANSSSQPVDSDLTTIAGLTATTNNFIISDSSAWASRTPTQAKATLAIASGDVSGLAASATTDTTNASNISSGTLAAARVATLNQDTTGSAATLTTPRAINSVNFDGSTAITVTADANTLSGTELKSTVVTSSLTSVGTIGTGVWQGTDIAVTDGGTGSSTAAAAKIALEVETAATGSTRVTVGTTAQRDGSPAAGYLRYNTTVASFEGYSGSAWGSVGGGATGASGDTIFVENSLVMTANYTLSTNKNASMVGPLTINSGVVLTIPSSARLVIL